MKKHQQNNRSIKLLTEEQLLKVKGGDRPQFESIHQANFIRWDEVILRIGGEDDRDGGSQRNNDNAGTNGNQGIIKF